MSLNRLDYTYKWETVENTVNDRISDDSLLHTLNADKKISKQTKVLNQKLKCHRNNIRDYKDFIKLRRWVGNACNESDETDDEPVLTHEEYQKLHYEKPKPQALRKFLRSSIRGKTPKPPRKIDKKSPKSEHANSNDSPDFKRPKNGNLPKRDIKKSQLDSKRKTSTSESFISQSKISVTELSEEENAQQNITEKVEQNHIHRDNNADETKDAKKIVNGLASIKSEKESGCENVDSNSETVELVDSENNMTVGNLSEGIATNEPQYDEINRLNGSFQLENKAEDSNDQKQDYSQVHDDQIAFSAALSYAKISNQDYLSSKEDILMTHDEKYRSKEGSDSQSNDKECIDSWNHDSGNNHLSDTDLPKYECVKISIKKVELCDFPQRKMSLEGRALSDYNSDSDISEEIPLAAPICYSTQLKGRLSTGNTVEDDKSQSKIRMIELYGEGYEIHSEFQLQRGTEIKTVNRPENSSIENESLLEDDCLLRLREFSTISNSLQNESQDSNRIIKHEDSAENECPENKLSLANEQPSKSRNTSGDCNLFQNESQHLNGSIDRQDALSMINLNEKNFDESPNNESHIKDEEQSEDDKSFKEYDISEIRSSCQNRSLNNSFSSFSARSCDEEVKNSVKTQLLSEIEQRLKDVQSAVVNRSSQHNQLKISNEYLHDETENLLLLSVSTEEGSNQLEVSNGSSHNETKNPLSVSKSDEEDVEDRLIDDELTMKDDTQSLKSNGSIRESDSLQIHSPISNRTSDSKDSLICPKSTPRKRRISDSEEDHCSLEITPNLSKLTWLHKKSTNTQPEPISHEDELTMKDDTQSLKSNGSSRESDSLQIHSPISNRTSDTKNCLIYPKSTPRKRRISDIEEEHCTFENTTSLGKLLRLHNQRAKKRLEPISHERKSQKSITRDLERPGAKDDSLIEDQEECSISRAVQPIPKKRPRPRNLEEYVAAESLIQDTTKAHFRLKDIDDDDEIWIMDVPKTLDPKDLENQTILLGGKNELRFGDECYKITSKPNEGMCNISCILSTSRRKTQYKIANIKSKGSIKFRRKFNVIPKTEPVPSTAVAVPFPKNLKTRHPLFGAFYKDKI